MVHDDPQQLGNPFACRGFSLWQGTLHGKSEELWDRADELDLEWALRRPKEGERDDEEDLHAPLYFDWPMVASKEQLALSTLFVVHPALVAYDADLGFRFADGGGDYRTLPALQLEKGKDSGYAYQLESYADHVRQMWAVYQRELAGPVAHVVARLEARLGLPAGSVDRATRLSIALHDVGKLQATWQEWARAYQQATGEGVPDFPMAHTHWEPGLCPGHRNARREADRIAKKPHHAGEGAVAVARLVHRAVSGHEGLRRAVLTAIARHHSPQAKNFDEKYRLEPAARAAIAEALRAVGLADGEVLVAELRSDAPSTRLEQLILQLPPESDWAWWLLYFLIVRAVRLADSKSQKT